MGSQWLLIRNGNVIDGTGASPMSGTSVLVRDDRIVQVGPGIERDAVPRGELLQEIDAAAKTVMPGLIDAHCHMTYGESRTEEEIDLYTSHELRTLKAAFNAQKVLRAGVTSISQPGGSYYIGVGLREAINDGIIKGPRMISAGRYITTSNGLTDWYPDSVGVPEGSIGILTNTLDQMVKEVRHQVKNGVDLIKLADSPMGEYQAFTDDEMKALADLTHQLQKRITIHARGSAEVDAAVKAGFDWIMHGNVMTDDVIERLAASEIPLVPTLTLLANIADWGDRVGAPPGLRDAFKQALERTGDTLHRAHEAGVKLISGTDSGFSVAPYGQWHARELELLMTYAGLSELEAIRAATKDAAVTLNLDNEVGAIAPGMLADILVVDGDPSKNIRVLQDQARILTVIKDGRPVGFDEEEIRRRWPHERGLKYSDADITYELIYGDGAEGEADARPITDEEAGDMTATLRAAERRAAATSSLAN